MVDPDLAPIIRGTNIDLGSKVSKFDIDPRLCVYEANADLGSNVIEVDLDPRPRIYEIDVDLDLTSILQRG